MNQIPNIEEGTKCRRCGMSLEDCPKTRWTNPLCVVNGVEWDEHVVGISTHHQKLQKEWEAEFDEIVGKDTLFVHKGKVVKFLHQQLQKASEEERWRCTGLVQNYLSPAEPERVDDILRDLIDDINDPEQMPIDDNGKFLYHSELDHQPDQPLNQERE